MRPTGLLILLATLLGQPAWSQPTPPAIPEPPDHVAARAKRLNDAWADLNRRLEKPVSLKATDLSVRDAARQVAEQIGARLLIDELSLTDEGISIDEPVQLQADGIAAEEVFRRFEQYGIEVIIDGSSLLLATQVAADERQLVRVYPVSDIVVFEQDGKTLVDFTQLMDLIQNVTTPWFDIDGIGGTMRPLSIRGAHLLVIRQKASVHRELENLLYDVRHAAKVDHNEKPIAAEGPQPPAVAPPAFAAAVDVAAPVTPDYVATRVERTDRAWADINARLSRPVWLNLKNIPRRQVLEKIADQIEVTLQFDEKSLRISPVRLDETISIMIEGQSAEEALRAAGKSRLVLLGEDESLFVTDRKYVKYDRLTTRVYPIDDLVVHGVSPDGIPVVDYTSIAHMLESVTSGPWFDVDGVGGTFRWLSRDGLDVLIVRQSLLVHREIEKLLYDLRKAPRSKTAAVNPASAEGVREGVLLPDFEWNDSSTTPSAENRPIAAQQTEQEFAADQAYRSAMSQVVNTSFEATPLRQASDALLGNLALPIEYDDELIAEANVDLQTPVTATFENRTLEEAIDELLQSRHLGQVRVGGRIIVTTAQARAKMMVTRHYRVDDLTWFVEPDRQLKHDAFWLDDAIQNTTQGRWADLEIDGIGGSIDNYNKDGSHLLVVRQTPAVHEEIENLLYRIREAKTNDAPTRR